MARNSHHVVPSNGGWNVKKGGAERASKTFWKEKTMQLSMVEM